MTNLSRYKGDLEKLIDLGDKLFQSIQAEFHPELYIKGFKEQFPDGDGVKFVNALPSFAEHYQRWYSESKSLVRQLLPDRLDDFVRHYEKPKSRKALGIESYRIEDCLQGLRVTHGYLEEVVADGRAAIPHMRQQLEILKSVRQRFESSLFDIAQLVQADVFDRELDSVKELTKAGFLRAAGAVAGVVLEKHLAQVLKNHGLTSRKANATISDFNDILKTSNVIPTPTWRKIQHLGDLRNICCHGKGKEPTKDEVEDLLAGVDSILKTVF